MKKRVLVFVLLFALVPSVVFGGSEQIKVQRNAATVVVNGEKISVDNFLYNGTTYVPLRAVSENMGAAVDWNNAAKTASISSNLNATDSDQVLFNTVLNHALYECSVATKDLTNAMAIHFLTSDNTVEPLVNLRPLVKSVTSSLQEWEEMCKTIGGDTFIAHQLISNNLKTANAVLEASISYNVDSFSPNAAIALDDCEDILDECDLNNEYVSILIFEIF